jgi:hypothetical protein
MSREIKVMSAYLGNCAEKLGKSIVRYIMKQKERMLEMKSDMDSEAQNLDRHVRIYGMGAPLKQVIVIPILLICK